MGKKGKILKDAIKLDDDYVIEQYIIECVYCQSLFATYKIVRSEICPCCYQELKEEWENSKICDSLEDYIESRLLVKELSEDWGVFQRKIGNSKNFSGEN